MTAPAPIVRKLALAQLAPFAGNARAALVRVGVADWEHAGVFQAHLTARCWLCDARTAPEILAALFTVGEVPAGRPAEALARLRQAYCCHAGCESRFYELTCTPHPKVDWATIGTDARPEPSQSSVGLAVSGAVMRQITHAMRSQLTWKLAVGLALLVGLLAWRQWWTGGSIPFFRAAKTFTSEGVAPEPMLPDDDPE